ncbi:hypothetical protein V8E36_005905 [Tilletia maclaganii]
MSGTSRSAAPSSSPPPPSSTISPPRTLHRLWLLISCLLSTSHPRRLHSRRAGCIIQSNILPRHPLPPSCPDSHPLNDNNMDISSSSSIDQQPPEKKRRILQACTVCSTKRVKCDGQRPCSTCVRNGEECSYAVPKKRGPPKGSTRAPRKSQQNQGSSNSTDTAELDSSVQMSSTADNIAAQYEEPLPQHTGANPVAFSSDAQGSTAFGLPPVPMPGPSTSSHLISYAQQPPTYLPRTSEWNTGAYPPAHQLEDPSFFGARIGAAVPGSTAQPLTQATGGMSVYPDSRSRGPETTPASHFTSQFHAPPHLPTHHGIAPPPLPPPLPQPMAAPRRGVVSQQPPSQHLAPSQAGAVPPELTGWYASHTNNGANAVSSASNGTGVANGAALAPSSVPQRTAYPSSQEASTHVNLTVPRHQHAGTSSRIVGPIAHPDSAIPTNRGALSSGNSTASSGAGAGAPLRGAAPDAGGSRADSRASSGPGNSSGLESGADPPSRFFRGGTSGLHGLATRLRDRDRQGGTAQEAAGGVVLRTFSGDRHGAADDIGEEMRAPRAPGAGSVPAQQQQQSPYSSERRGSAVVYRGDERAHERMDSGASMGDGGEVVGVRTRSSLGRGHQTHLSTAPQRRSSRQAASAVLAPAFPPSSAHPRPQHAPENAADASPLHSPSLGTRTLSGSTHQGAFNRRGAGSSSGDHAFGTSHSTSSTTSPNMVSGADFSGTTSRHGGDLSSAAETRPSSTTTLAFPSTSPASRGAPAAHHHHHQPQQYHPPPQQHQAHHPRLAIDASLTAMDPGPVSASGWEDDPRLHEMMWKAASAPIGQDPINGGVGASGSGAGAGAGGPVRRALNEASEVLRTESVAGDREDLDGLEVAVGDLWAPDFESPLVSVEVEQKLLHLWIANIGTHWTPVAPPTHDDIEAQPFEPKSDSEQHRNEACVQKVLAAWRAILQPERRPLLWNAILSMAADAWGGDLNEAAYPRKANSTSALSASRDADDDESNTGINAMVSDPAQGRREQGRASEATHFRSGEGTDQNGSVTSGLHSHRNSLSGDWIPHKSTHLIGSVRTGRQLSTAMFIRAKFFLQKTNQDASLEAIQASVFMALRESGAGRASQAAHYSTNACRMALDLGLHRHKAVKRAMGPAFTRHEDESRRRTLWCAYMLDKVIAFILGRPAILRHAEIDCPFPSEDWCDEEMPWVLMAERFVSPTIRDRMRGVPSMVPSTAKLGSELACIGEKIIEQYNIVKPTDWQRWVKCIHTQLKAWYASLKPEMLNRDKHLPHSMNQLMWYNTLRILLHRPHILKPTTDPEMPSSHAECTDAVTQVCQLLSIYESFYNVRKVSTSLAFILFTSVTIALSNTTSNDPALVAEAKQRLRELMRWFKKASENYRAAQHHLSIINVLAEGIEVGTSGPVHHREDEASKGAATERNAVAISGPPAGSYAAAGQTAALNGALHAAQVEPGSSNVVGQHVTTANFTGFAHSGANYAYPAETLAAAQAAWRGKFVMPAGGPEAQGSIGSAATNGLAAPGQEIWTNQGIPTAPQVATAGGNPLDFLDSQAYLNLQSEAYWGAMPVSSENLLLWNTFHNEYLSALAACAVDQSTAAAGPVNNSVVTSALAGAMDAAGPASNDASMVPGVLDPVSVAGVAAGVYSIFSR